MSAPPLLSLRVSAGYPGKPGVLRDVRLEMQEAEILGLVGQSGCGKSSLALTILRLLHLKNGKAEGSIQLKGRELMALKEKEIRSLRGREMGLVLQSPMSSLNPALRIGTQLEEAWRVHQQGSHGECQEALLAALENVSLPGGTEILKRYPSQLSVGQAQRVLIAMAALHHPALLIADEATSALDLITQAEILELFRELSHKFKMGILYISHDLLSVATISHRVAVMHAGEIIECRQTAEIFRDPQHSYTKELIRALPVVPQFAAAGR